jgi:hypothetical protein
VDICSSVVIFFLLLFWCLHFSVTLYTSFSWWLLNRLSTPSSSLMTGGDSSPHQMIKRFVFGNLVRFLHSPVDNLDSGFLHPSDRHSCGHQTHPGAAYAFHAFCLSTSKAEVLRHAVAG